MAWPGEGAVGSDRGASGTVVGVGGSVLVVVVVVDVVAGLVVVKPVVVAGPGATLLLLHAEASRTSVTAITIERMAPRYKASASVELHPE